MTKQQETLSQYADNQKMFCKIMQRNWKKQTKKEEKNEKSATNSLLHNHTYHKIKIKG
jgi:hypothetical protein